MADAQHAAAFHSINGQIYWRTTKLSDADVYWLRGLFRDQYHAAVSAGDDTARLAPYELYWAVQDAMTAQVNQLARIA